MDPTDVTPDGQDFPRAKSMPYDPDLDFRRMGRRVASSEEAGSDVRGTCGGVRLDEIASGRRGVGDADERIASDPIAIGTVIPHDRSEFSFVLALGSMDRRLRRDMGIDHCLYRLHLDPVLDATATNHRQAYGRKAARGLVLCSSFFVLRSSC